jgi:hypothetical protein
MSLTPDDIELVKAIVDNRLAEITRRNAGRYLSGRWHRRDGDVYGIVQRQPPIPVPDDADNPPGDLRPPHQR